MLSLIGEGKSIAAAYPDEVLSIEKYTKGMVKPGMIISKENAELVKDLCFEGLYMELQRGAQIKIAETTLRADALIPPYWVEATLRNKGQAVLDKKGQLWHKDGRQWIGGDPFPEAKTGLEAAWNSVFNFRRYDDVRSIAPELNVDSSGTVVRKGASFFTRIQAVGRLAVEPKPIIPQYKDELYRTILSVVEPFDSYGLAITTTNKYDASRLPDTDLYIPTLRRTRRVSSTQRFEPPRPYAAYFASDFDVHNDPLLTWSWQLVWDASQCSTLHLLTWERELRVPVKILSSSHTLMKNFPVRPGNCALRSLSLRALLILKAHPIAGSGCTLMPYIIVPNVQTLGIRPASYGSGLFSFSAKQECEIKQS